MSVAVHFASWALLVAGGAFCMIGALGVLRMPDFYTRLHAAGVVDTLGAGLILLGLALQAGWTLVAVKLLVVALLLLLTSPVASHSLAKAALGRGLAPRIAQPEAPSKR